MLISSSQAFDEDIGPEHAPYRATVSNDTFVYRVLRKGENPWRMRVPPDIQLEYAELRTLLVTAIAHGNNPEQASDFLHATGSLTQAIRIKQERRYLYSNWLVRWRRDSVDDRIDFETKGDLSGCAKKTPIPIL